MKGKTRALKALLIFFVVVFVCMFCARTVQTIVTPKVKRVSAVKGKLEQTISLEGEVTFASSEKIYLRDAKKLNVTVDQVSAKTGYFLKKGETVFTAFAPSLDEEMGKLNEAYLKAVGELSTEQFAHIRIKSTSAHNDIYNAAQKAADDYYTALVSARVAAMRADYTLPDDQAAWGELAGAPEEVRKAAKNCLDLYTAYQTAEDDLLKVYKTGQNRVGDATFSFVLKCDGFRKTIAENLQSMLELQALSDGLSTVTAPHDGYIVSVDVKEGDSCDGSKMVYSISPEGAYPVIRADITSVDKTIETGATVKAGEQKVSLKVTNVLVAADGKKTMEIQLDADSLSALGGLSRLMGEKVSLTLEYKARKSSTLLPASAVRQEGENSYYVYVVTQSYGGLLDSAQYTLSKQTVTVLEKGDKMVSISDDMSYREIADQEDRSLTDGAKVMDYAD